MKRAMMRLFFAAAAAVFLFCTQANLAAQTAPGRHKKPKAPRTVRLYVFDCGVLHNSDMGRFNLKNEDVTTSDMSMACFLIAHPKGNLIWDTGAIPDNSWKPTGAMIAQHVNLPDGSTRYADVDKNLVGSAEGNWLRALPTSISSRCRTTITITRATPMNSRARHGLCRRWSMT